MNSFTSKYIKLTALEGTFSPTQNIVSFSIPAGQKIDLSETTVLVNLGVISPDVTPAPGTSDGVAGIYNTGIVFDDNGVATAVLKPVAYVKNADMRCERVGAVETLRAINTLRLALDIYQEDLETKQDEQYLGGFNSQGVGGFNGTPFRDLNKNGTINSRNRNATLRIPLKDIFDVAEAPVWDTTKYGRTDIKLEMAFDALSVVQTLGATDPVWTSVPLGNYSAIDAFTGGGAGGAGNVTEVKPTKTYSHPESQCPYYVGQVLKFDYQVNPNGAGNVATTAQRTITGIAFNADDDLKLTLTLSSAIVLVQNDVVSAVTAVGVDCAPSTIVFNKCQLELKQVNDPTPPSIEYTTYSTEEDSGFSAGQTNINKQYTCEAQADNLVVCAMGTGRINPTIKIDTSRITINSKEETPEQVVGRVTGGGNVGQAEPLYYDRIDRTYLNMGGSISCVQEAQLGLLTNLQTNPAAILASGLLNPLPMTGANKQVQLDINYQAGEIQRLNLYKRMVKQI